MQILLKCLWISAAIQMVIFLANFYLPFKLQYGKNISALSPFFRQIFVTHAVYIAGVVLSFSIITFIFASDLASGRGLGRFLASALGIFWLCRIPIQLFYFDKDVRRAHRAGDIAMTLAVTFLAATYCAAATIALW
jgi:hypothetical protein